MANLVAYNYDSQIRRFVIQFIRMFSNFQVEFGTDQTGTRSLQTIPVYYGDPDRQASAILKNNSENMINAVPAIAVYISELAYDRERLQNPYHESVMRVREQAFNLITQEYTGLPDNVYTVERLMPAPYKLTMKMDVWTSNKEQKFQIIEQFAPFINPSFEIQNSDNYLDWTSLSVVNFINLTYSNRMVPHGNDESTIDILTYTFEIPIWIAPPTKVKKGGIISQIIANIYDDTGSFSNDIIDIMATSQLRYTPLNYEILYSGNTLTLYKAINESGNGVAVPWSNLINLYGVLQNGISQVRMEFAYPDGVHEVVGTVAQNPSNPSQLLFTPTPNNTNSATHHS